MRGAVCGTRGFRMVAPIGERVLARIHDGLTQGAIEATLPGGERRVIGDRAPGPRPIVHVVRWRALRRLASGGSAGWYEAWVAGDWTSPDPVALFELFMLNRRTLGNAARASGLSRLARRTWHWLRRNHRAGARRNVEAHYDLGNDFYRAWLEPSLTSSSALFDEPVAPGQSLESAQATKLAAILDRTATSPGDTILEIGCGWGSFAAVASAAGVEVQGITLSEEQKAFVAWRDRRAFGLHYAETLARWRAAFDRAVDEQRLPARFDAHFVAMWRYYLMYCEGGFRGGGIDVVQVTLVKEG